MTGDSEVRLPDPIGRSIERRDGLPKVTGRATFTVDVSLPRMAHAALLRSPYAHARIRRIEVAAARRHPGVVAVVSAVDLADVDLYYGHAVADHPLIADGVVRFAGEPVVGVVADDAATAHEALRLVEVEYEPLPVVADIDAALAPDAVAIHETLGAERPHRGFAEHLERPVRNVCSRSHQGWGDVDTALAAADLILEGEYRYPMCYAFAMEPYAAVASFDADGLTIWSSAQHPYMVREDLAGSFRLPLSSVRVIVPYVGGGFGSKSYTKIEPLAAALALRAGRPVRLALNVAEAILTTRGDSARVHLVTGFDRDGRILARRATVELDSGAYAENSPLVARKAANRLGGPYRIGALDVTATSVYTNTAPASSFRGFGAPQVTFAGESQVNEAAARLGIDALEIRRRNLLDWGERPWPGVRALDADLAADLQLVENHLDWGEPPGPHRGRGVALSASDAGSDPTSSAVVRVHADGSVTVLCGSTEMGQGSATVLAQITAGLMGVPVERVALVQSDTATVTYDRSTGASRTTTIMGLAIQEATRDVIAQLTAWSNEAIAMDGADVRAEPGGVAIGDRHVDWGEIVRAWFGSAGGEAIGRGTIRRAGTTETLPPFWEIGCVGAEVEVDEATGIVTVLKVVTVGDVGMAINPMLVEGQDIGAATMGLGMALREELVYDAAGNLLTPDLYEYRVPRASDAPEFVPILAERHDGIGVGGAKGGGEGSLNPIAAAIAEAIYQAAAVRLTEAPFTPERVWRAIQARDREVAAPDR